MDEQRLWAPWRLGYIKGQDSEAAVPSPDGWRPGAATDCFLCRYAASYADQDVADCDNMVVMRTKTVQAVLNRYPYSNGHLLVAPLRHVSGLSDLNEQERLESIDVLAQLQVSLEEKLSAQGFNIGLNLGQVAGAGVPGHLHWHLVPRWPGDHNFMSVTAATRVIPQALDELWQALRSR